MSRRKQSKPRAFLKLGETSASGTAEELEACEDPLALLDPKEELLSETESLEMDDEDEKAVLNVPTTIVDTNHKHTTHTPAEPPPTTPPPEVSATTTTILPAITSNNNNGHIKNFMDSSNKMQNKVTSNADNRNHKGEESSAMTSEVKNNNIGTVKEADDSNFNEFDDLDDDIDDDEDIDEDLLSLDSYYSGTWKRKIS